MSQFTLKQYVYCMKRWNDPSAEILSHAVVLGNGFVPIAEYGRG
jgi:hypothetical protein